MLNRSTSKAEKKKSLETILEEQTVIFVRESYSHMLSLTRTAVALNVVTLIAGSVLYRLTISTRSEQDILPNEHYWFYIVFGFLIMAFGVVFNIGALYGYRGLRSIINDFGVCWKKYLSQKHFLTSPYSQLEKSLLNSGPVHRLTHVFFCISAVMWLSLGVYLMLFGYSISNLPPNSFIKGTIKRSSIVEYPQTIQKKGKNEFVILPYGEFTEMKELIEDFRGLRAAKVKSTNEGSTPINEAINNLKNSKPKALLNKP